MIIWKNPFIRLTNQPE